MHVNSNYGLYIGKAYGRAFCYLFILKYHMHKQFFLYSFTYVNEYIIDIIKVVYISIRACVLY